MTRKMMCVCVCVYMRMSLENICVVNMLLLDSSITLTKCQKNQGTGGGDLWMGEYFMGVANLSCVVLV